MVVAVGPAAVRADSLDRELLKQAPRVIRYLQDHGYKNVGVLKFRVKKGDELVSDRVGSLNLTRHSRNQTGSSSESMIHLMA